MAKHKWLKPTLTTLFYVALLAFIVYALHSITPAEWAQLAHLHLEPWFLLAACATALGFRYWQTFIWITVLRGLGARNIHMNPALTYVYAKSWMGRYIPGTAPWILGKIYFASQHGVSKTKLAVGSLLEAAIQIAVLLCTSSIMLLLIPSLDVPALAPYKPIMVIVIVCAIIGLIPPVFNRLMALAFRILRRPPLARENYATTRTILTAAGLYVFGALLSGTSLFFIVASMYPAIGAQNFFFVVATGNLASAVSMLAVFAPGGVGVRESIQGAFLATLIPLAVATLAVIVTRIWGIAMDSLFFGGTRLILFLTGRRSPAIAPEQESPARSTLG